MAVVWYQCMGTGSIVGKGGCMKKVTEQKPQNQGQGPGRKRAYRKPVLTNLGSVAKITQSFTGSIADFMGQRTKMN